MILSYPGATALGIRGLSLRSGTSQAVEEIWSRRFRLLPVGGLGPPADGTDPAMPGLIEARETHHDAPGGAGG